jgi:hypothetical protein
VTNLTFIEATRFTARILQLRAEQNLGKLEDLLCQNPESGALIQRSGGCRKIRMGLPGRGKRGGCRVIYLHVKSASRIYFLYLYPKNEEVDLSAEQKESLKHIAHAIYEEAKNNPSIE